MVLEVEAAAKQNPEVAQSMEPLVTTVDAQALPNLEPILQEITKALESHQATVENYNIDNVNNQTRFNQAPPLPPYYVERPEVSQQLKQILLSQETAQAGTLVVSAIYGLGGIGKSTLAAALAHDEEVQSHFNDGIFWGTLGQQPDILSILSSWIQQLGDYDFKAINIDSASLQLKTLLSDKKALLIVDDVWHPDHVEPFRVAGDGCRVLVTTREAQVEGAIPYDLDVMTPNESLELLTACFNNDLTAQELDYAETLAKTVGYLPLALELAAAQVRDGISWQELLGELEDLIVGVEALDRLKAEEEPSDAKRKNYSLVASFNLSLKGLFDDDRLKKFAWLGILPEDISITETMATTLWDCNLVGAKDTLRYLRQKALLLPGLSTTPDTNYRLHDLLHDLARRLVQAELGLSITEAHQQLLERYQSKTDKGLWHTLPDDGYIYNHLIWHLEKAKKINEIHQLLKEETPAGDNGWYWQCERQGKTANFIKDVSRAWAIAADNFTENPTESISLQCRYALITTSLNSLAGNIPPKLMAALVKKEMWTPAQALAYVRQSKDSFGQAKGLEAISEYLPPSLLPEALDVARGIGDQYYRARALRALVPHLSEVLLAQALDSARGITEEFSRANALEALAPHLPERLLLQALEWARGISDEYWRADALISLAPHLPDLLPEALDSVRGISSESERGFALIRLAPHLPDLLPEALNCARGIGFEFQRANALIDLAPHLPEELLSQALDCARGIRDESHRARALGALAPHLPEVLLEALDSGRTLGDEFQQVNALGALAPQLPDLLLSQALDSARRISDQKHRANALIGLAPHLPEVLPEALDSARALGDKQDRANALIGLAPHLPEVLPEALDSARALGYEQDRVKAFIALAPHLSEVLLAQALGSVRAFGDESQRARAFIALAPHLSEVLLAQALESVRAFGDQSRRAKALITLAPHLSDVLPEALNCARGIRYEFHRADALIALAPHLPDVLLPQVLDCATALGNEENRARALGALAPHLPQGFLHQALDYATALGNEEHRARALGALAPHLSDVLLPQALDSARRILDEYYRARALGALAPHLPDVLLPQVLDCVRALGNEECRASALVALAPHLSDVLLPQALDCARGISDKLDRADALMGLASQFPEVLPEALDGIRGVDDEVYRAEVLKDLIKSFNTSSVYFYLWQKILDALTSLTRPYFLNNLPQLAPLIIKFGGVEALRETVAAVDDVSRWWK